MARNLQEISRNGKGLARSGKQWQEIYEKLREMARDWRGIASDGEEFARNYKNARSLQENVRKGKGLTRDCEK